jgi:hypothetical protein
MQGQDDTSIGISLKPFEYIKSTALSLSIQRYANPVGQVILRFFKITGNGYFVGGSAD